MVDLKKCVSYVACVALVRILYDVIYINMIVPFYGNNVNTFCVRFDSYQYLLSWMVMFAFLPFVISLINRVTITGTSLVIIYFIHFIPCVSLMGLKQSDFWELYIVYYSVLFIIGVVVPKEKHILTRVCLVDLDKMVVVIGTIIMICLWGVFTRFRLFFDISSVYSIRLEAREFNVPVVLRYFHNWIKLFSPFLMCFFLINKKYIYSVLCSLTGLILFFYDGQKSVLFEFGISFLIYFFVEKRKKNISLYFFSKGIIVAEMLGLMEFLLFNNNRIVNYIIRRLCFLPALLDYYYIDFFSTNPKNHFSDMLRRIGIMPKYPVGLPRTIGQHYFGNINTNANNGLLSDAYANAGIVGIIVMPILVIILLLGFDFISTDLEESLKIVISFLISMILISTNLTTALLSNGLIVLMFFIVFNKLKSQGKHVN